MIFEISHSPHDYANGTVKLEERHTMIVKAPAEIDPRRQLYRLRQKFIPLEGGKLVLRLLEEPTVEFDVASQKCAIKNWKLQFNVADIGDVSRMLARKFLELFSKSDMQCLSASEKADWLSILDAVDYRSFTVARAAPRYVEGQVIRKFPVVVEWHDGQQQTITAPNSSSLAWLNEGEFFGAFVKWDEDNKVQILERVVLIPRQPATEDWPD